MKLERGIQSDDVEDAQRLAREEALRAASGYSRQRHGGRGAVAGSGKLEEGPRLWRRSFEWERVSLMKEEEEKKKEGMAEKKKTARMVGM